MQQYAGQVQQYQPPKTASGGTRARIKPITVQNELIQHNLNATQPVSIKIPPPSTGKLNNSGIIGQKQSNAYNQEAYKAYYTHKQWFEVIYIIYTNL